MRNLLAFLSALTLTFFGVGWYLGWYKLHSQPGAEGHRSVTIDINTIKIGADLERGRQELQEIIEKAGKESNSKDKSAEAKDKNVTHHEKEGKPLEANPILPVKGELEGSIKTRPAAGKQPKEGEENKIKWFDFLPK
jgi:hypothetical protein